MQELVQHRPAQDGRAVRHVDRPLQCSRWAVDGDGHPGTADRVAYATIVAPVAVELIVIARGQVRNEDEVVEFVRVVRVEAAGERAQVELGVLQ